jgi:hypothetical protein
MYGYQVPQQQQYIIFDLDISEKFKQNQSIMDKIFQVIQKY